MVCRENNQFVLGNYKELTRTLKGEKMTDVMTMY